MANSADPGGAFHPAAATLAAATMVAVEAIRPACAKRGRRLKKLRVRGRREATVMASSIASWARSRAWRRGVRRLLWRQASREAETCGSIIQSLMRLSSTSVRV